MESPDDQVYSKQTRNIKQSKNKRENKSRISGIERFIPGNGAKNVAALYTPLGDVEEIFNPLGVSLGASES